MKYHLNKPGSKDLDGPFDLEKALNLIEEGKYGLNDNVWNAEKKCWQLVREVPALNRKIRKLEEKENKKVKLKQPAPVKKNKESELLASSHEKAGLKEKLIQKGDELKRAGKQALEENVLKDVEVRESKIEYHFPDFKGWLSSAFSKLFGRLHNKRWPNFVYLGIFLVPTVIISFCSFGLLLGPLSAGYLLLVLNVLNEKPTRFRFSDLLEGDRYFVRTFWIGLTLNFFPLGLLWGLVLVLEGIDNSLLGIALMVGLTCLFGLVIAVEFFAFMLILERDQKWNEALLHSFGFLKGGLLKVVPVIGIVGALSFFLGLLAIYVGIMITIPFYIIFMVYLFRHCSCQYFGLPAIEIGSTDPVQLEESATNNA